MKKNLFTTGLILIVLLVILSGGCATLFKGSTEEVNFSSNTSGAKVYVNGVLRGETPLPLKLKSDATYTIEFRKEGFKNRTVVINSDVGAGWIILDILGGGIPIIVDAISGDWHGLDQENVNAALEKQQ